MRRTLLSLTVAVGIAAGTAAPAVAQDATSSSIDLPGIIGSSDPIFTEGPLGSLFTDADYSPFLVATLAAGAAGVTWAVQQRLIANPLPGIIPGPPAR